MAEGKAEFMGSTMFGGGGAPAKEEKLDYDPMMLQMMIAKSEHAGGVN